MLSVELQPGVSSLSSVGGDGSNGLNETRVVDFHVLSQPALAVN